MNNKTIQPKQRVGIIADDLTGAGDSGIQFAIKGFETNILFDIENEKHSSIDDITVVNTDSRDLSINTAYNKAYHVASIFKQKEIKNIFKKIDSSLRGNWGTEVQAITDVYQPDFVVVAPAYPIMGKTTDKGSQYINGIPIHKSEVANDPKFPVRNSNIADILKQQPGSQSKIVENVPLWELRKDDYLWNKLQRLKQQEGIKYLIFDALYDSDLQQIINLFTKLKELDILWVGTAGIAQYLPDMFTSSKTSVPSFHGNDGPVLVIAGSKTVVTRNQIKELTKKGNITKIEFNPLAIFENDEGNARSELIQQSCQSLKGNQDVVLCIKDLSSQQQKHIFELGNRYGYTNIQIGNKIVEQLGEITKVIMKKHPVKSLVLTGGDTAMSICRTLGVSGIKLMKEIEPGIPIGQLVGKSNITVVTKSGGFGFNASLVNAVNTLKGDV